MKNIALVPRTQIWRIIEFSTIGGAFTTKILFHPETSWLVPVISGLIVFTAYAVGTNLYWKFNPEVLDAR